MDAGPAVDLGRKLVRQDESAHALRLPRATVGPEGRSGGGGQIASRKPSTSRRSNGLDTTGAQLPISAWRIGWAAVHTSTRNLGDSWIAAQLTCKVAATTVGHVVVEDDQRRDLAARGPPARPPGGGTQPLSSRLPAQPHRGGPGSPRRRPRRTAADDRPTLLTRAGGDIVVAAVVGIHHSHELRAHVRFLPVDARSMPSRPRRDGISGPRAPTVIELIPRWSCSSRISD